LLSARLGAEQILQPAPLADHRPEIANNWVPLDASTISPAISTTTKSAASAMTTQGSSVLARQTVSVTASQATRTTVSSTPAPLTERPFWLLAEPLALSVRNDRPIYHGPLQLLRGPERIESGWWDHLRIARDYFVAQDQHAARYWIYRERDTEQARWFLHGLFA
jgi:protein ImuB